jgi:hypothetical protein
VVDPSSRGAPLRLDRPGTVSDHHNRGLPVTANAAARVPLARQAGLEPNKSGAKRCEPDRPEDETAVRESPDDDSDARQIGQRLLRRLRLKVAAFKQTPVKQTLRERWWSVGWRIERPRGRGRKSSSRRCTSAVGSVGWR